MTNEGENVLGTRMESRTKSRKIAWIEVWIKDWIKAITWTWNGARFKTCIGVDASSKPSVKDLQKLWS